MKSDIILKPGAQPVNTWTMENELKVMMHPEDMLSLAGIGKADAWQTEVARSDDPRIILDLPRQIGKSTTLAMIGLKEALFGDPGIRGDILFLSKSFPQALELLRRTRELYAALGRPHALTGLDEKTKIVFDNGIRIISLPENENTIRTYTARMIIIDEASRVTDSLYKAVRPMLATTKGRLVLASTPFGKRGFFYNEWNQKSASEHWTRFKLDYSANPRMDNEYVNAERRALGELFKQEYCGEFVDFGFSVIDLKDVDNALARGNKLQALDL